MSEVADALAATPAVEEPKHRRGQHSTGFEYEHDGHKGWIQTGPLPERPKTWDEFIKDAGLDPDEVEVIEPVQVRGWDSQTSDGVVRMRYYRLNIRRRMFRADVDELIKAAKQRGRRLESSAQTDTTQAFVLALGDLQLGKMDGDGVEGTVARYYAATEAAVKRYKRVAKGAPVYLIHLGDCIEGFQSQGGANAWRTVLTTTEQVDLYRRLLLDQIKAFERVAPRLVVVGIPGNHDEAHRPLHTYGDSWAIDACRAVRQAIEFAGGYDHVTIHTPARDELTLTLDICGTRVGMAHGHQFGRGADGWKTWWKGQQHGRQPIGDADILLAGHFHHLRVQRDGTGADQAARTFIQTPALEAESTWWRHRSGEGGDPGVVTFLTGDGHWWGLEVL